MLGEGMALTNATNATLFQMNSTVLPPLTVGPRRGVRPSCDQLKGMCLMAIQTMRLSMLRMNTTNDSMNVNATPPSTQNISSSTAPPFSSSPPANTTKRATRGKQLPPVCRAYQAICMRPRQAPSVHIKRLGITMGVFGILAFVLNIFVIGRILYQNMRKIHQSKMYFLSMAFADMYFGICCFIYTLLLYKVIVFVPTPKNTYILTKWWEISIHVTFCASLFHVVMITADRFMATTFPLVHKICITRKKVIAIIFGLWLLSVIISLLPYWLDSPKFSTWFSSLTITFGSVLLIVTYAHISTVAVKRRKTLKQLSRNKGNFKNSVRSINTTLLSASITTTFIICNVFSAIYAYMYLFSNIQSNMVVNFVEMLLLNINAAINPVLYTIVEFLHNKVHKRRSSVSESSGGRKITTCSTIDRSTRSLSTVDRVTRSVESVATINSQI